MQQVKEQAKGRGAADLEVVATDTSGKEPVGSGAGYIGVEGAVGAAGAGTGNGAGEGDSGGSGGSGAAGVEGAAVLEAGSETTKVEGETR